MYAVAYVVYFLLCAGIAWSLAWIFTRRAKPSWRRWAVGVVLLPIVFLLPLSDEIIGTYQFERLCDEAKEVKIYGSILVGQDLYTTGGQWRLSVVDKDWRKLNAAVEGYLRWEPTRLPVIPAAIEIRGTVERVYEAKTGRLLAEWRQYATSGGWLSKFGAIGEGRLLGREQCVPKEFGSIPQLVLKFEQAGGSR